MLKKEDFYMKKFFTSESVTEGHPDKVCDNISDGILDAILAQDPMARAAIECAAAFDTLLIMGEVTTTAEVDYEAKAREMFYRLSDVEVMSELYEIKVKEMIFAALAREEEVYIPVFRFDGQISNLGNVRKMSDKSIVEKYYIDGVEVFDLDLVYGKDEGEENTFEVQSLFDNILYGIAKGWYVEGEEDYEYYKQQK
jgi:hypothetical protein